MPSSTSMALLPRPRGADAIAQSHGRVVHVYARWAVKRTVRGALGHPGRTIDGSVEVQARRGIRGSASRGGRSSLPASERQEDALGDRIIDEKGLNVAGGIDLGNLEAGRDRLVEAEVLDLRRGRWKEREDGQPVKRPGLPELEGQGPAIEARLPDVPRPSKAAAVWAVLILTDDAPDVAVHYAASEDDDVREGVARVFPLVEAEKPTSLGLTLANDQERRVQNAAIENFENTVSKPASEMRALLEELAAADPQSFTCYHCGTSNPADARGCTSCNFVTEEPAVKARALLKKWEEASSA